MCVHVCQHSHLHSTRQPPAAPVWTTGVSFKSFRAPFTVLHENHWAGATADRERSQPWLKSSRLQSIRVYTGIHSKSRILLVFTYLPNSNLPCSVWPGILQITIKKQNKTIHHIRLYLVMHRWNKLILGENSQGKKEGVKCFAGGLTLCLCWDIWLHPTLFYCQMAET